MSNPRNDSEPTEAAAGSMHASFSAPLLGGSLPSHGTFGDNAQGDSRQQRTRSVFDDEDMYDDSTQQREAQSVARHAIVMRAVQRSVLALLCLPFVGTLFIGIALQEKRRRYVTLNPTDWMVLLWVGFCAQASLIAPLVNLVSDDAHRVLTVELFSDADYLGPLVVFPATSLYLTATIVAFIGYSTKQRIASVERRRDIVLSRVASRQRKRGDLLESIQQIKFQIQEDTVLPTWFVIPLSMATGFSQMISLRVCRWSDMSNLDPTLCDNDALTFTIPKYNSVYYHLASSYWILTFTALTGLIYLALFWYYQQLRQIERFTYFSKSGKNAADTAAAKARRSQSPQPPTRAPSPASPASAGGSPRAASFASSTGPPSFGSDPSASGSGGTHLSSATRRLKRKLDTAKDIFSPKNLSLWVSVWKELLRDLRERPSMQAVSVTTVVSCIISGGACVTYVLFDNIYEGSAVAEFTGGCIVVFVFCCCALGMFLFITVRLQYVVDYQVKAISETQTSVQRQLDAEMNHEQQGEDDSGRLRQHRGNREGDAARFQLLRAKVNVLQALDTVLRTSESKPKLLGLSLESIRWSVIMIGLAIMNVAFFVLYRTRCKG